MQRLLGWSLLAVLTVTYLLGCNTHAKWTYPLDSAHLHKSVQRQYDLTIAVMPFREERPSVNRSATLLLYLIPLMPFGWVTYERPEAAQSFITIKEFDFQLDEDLGKAAARSLDQSGIVRRSYFTFGGETREADYILKGTAKSTRYKGRILSYGLSAFGPLLWYIAFPAGTSENLLHIEFLLVDQRGEEHWRFKYEDSESIVQGLYYNWGNDAVNFAAIMENAMNAGLRNLEENLRILEEKARNVRKNAKDFD